MSGKFHKTMLRVGTYQSADGEVKVTPERLKRWAENHARMSANSQVVPMHWDHGNDIESLRPLDASEYSSRSTRSAANTVGRMLEITPSADGMSAEVTYSTSDPVATSKSEANDVYVSPVIFPRWKDGHGNQYEDVITHLDIVNHPVDHSQSPATRLDGVIACSLRFGAEGKPVRLGLPDMDKDGKPDQKPMPDDVTKDPAANGDNKPDGMPPIGDLPEEPTRYGVGDIMMPLAELGVVLPDDTTDENLIDRLRTALMVLASSQGGGMAAGDTFGQTGETIVQEPQIATMSLYANTQYKENLTIKLNSLLKSGRCSPAEHTEQAAKVSAVKLSLDAEGNPAPQEVSAWIDSRASLPEGAVWTPEEKAKRMSVQPHPQPTSLQDYDESPSADEIKEATAMILK